MDEIKYLLKNNSDEILNQINSIMWESYMVEGNDFGRIEGYKIMGLLEQWSEIQSKHLEKIKEYGKKREDDGYKKGWQDATNEAIKEIHKNYRPNE